MTNCQARWLIRWEIKFIREKELQSIQLTIFHAIALAAQHPALTGAITGGLSGFFDRFFEDYNLKESLKAGAFGAILGAVGGFVLGKIFRGLGARFMHKLSPQTLVRLVHGLFAANLASTFWSVYTAKSSEQMLFRGSLGFIGLMGNGLAIRKVSQWVRELNKADTLLLAATERAGKVMGVDVSGSNVVRNNLIPDQLPVGAKGANLVADQIDIPLPGKTFKKIVGNHVQLAGSNFRVGDVIRPGGEGMKAFKEWYRLLDSGGEITVSIANGAGFQDDLTAAFRAAGFTDVEFLGPGPTGSAVIFGRK